MTTELLTPAAALNLSLDVVEFRPTAASGYQEEAAEIQSCDVCCCCSCCCGVEDQADVAA